MPEGDTVHKLSRALRAELEGATLRGVWLRDRGWLKPLSGWTLDEVAAAGKHLLFVLAAPDSVRPAWVLHVHLGMKGRFQRYGRGEAWRRPASWASVRLDTAERSYLGFRVALAELLRPGSLGSHPVLSRLGPDLLAPELSLASILARARRREPRSVAELLLDQTVASGIGNVYKSEVLFLAGLHPSTSVAALSDATLGRLYRRARRLLRWNLGGWPRTTVRRVTADTPLRRDEPRFRVYGRGGRPCLRCGTAIVQGRIGDEARHTCWCPRCQPAPADRGTATCSRAGNGVVG